MSASLAEQGVHTGLALEETRRLVDSLSQRQGPQPVSSPLGWQRAPSTDPEQQPATQTPPSSGWPTAYWYLPPLALEPLHLRATFYGDPAKLALFLSQIISHLGCYAHVYPTQRAMVKMVTTLEGEAAEWVADLHSENAQELGNAGMFSSVS